MSRRGRPPLHLDVTPEQLDTLRAWREAHQDRPSLAIRAEIVLLSAEGLSSANIAASLDCGAELVAKWRHKWRGEGLGILSLRPRQGRNTLRTVDEVRNLLRGALVSGPDATHISTREGARLLEVSQPTAYRAFQKLGLVTRRQVRVSGMSFFSQRQPTLLALELSPRALVLALAQQDLPWPLHTPTSAPAREAAPHELVTSGTGDWTDRLRRVVGPLRQERQARGRVGQRPPVALRRILQRLHHLSVTCGRVHLVVHGELPTTTALDDALRRGLLFVHRLQSERAWLACCGRLLNQPGWRSLGETSLSPLSALASAIDEASVLGPARDLGFSWLTHLDRHEGSARASSSTGA